MFIKIFNQAFAKLSLLFESSFDIFNILLINKFLLGSHLGGF